MHNFRHNEEHSASGRMHNFRHNEEHSASRRRCVRQTVAPQRGALLIEATLRPDSLLGEFTKASESRVSETSDEGEEIFQLRRK